MDFPSDGIRVVRLERSDALGVDEARACLRDAFALPQPRVLVDVTPIDSVDGTLLAAMFVACKALPADGRIALLASEDVVRIIGEWGLDGLWECFDSSEAARAYLTHGTASALN